MAFTLDEQCEYIRLYRRAFPEKKRAIDAAWRKANPEKCRASGATWRRAHPEKHRVNSAMWRKTNPEKKCAQEVRRRARKRNALLPGPQWEIDKIYIRRDQLRVRGLHVEVDHIYPLGFGWHEPANLQIILASENHRKQANPDYKPSKIFT